MIPTLFPANWLDLVNYQPGGAIPPHGDIDLVDCIECFAEETEDECSEWELEITYPSNGYGIEQLIQESNGAPIGINKLILAKANSYQNPQFFRIYAIERRIGGNIGIKAQHISYDMVNIPVRPYKATGATAAVNGLNNNAAISSRFSFSTDISSSDVFQPDTPSSMRAMLLDGDDSIHGTFGGDVIFDNCVVQLKQLGGADRDVTINYGVDLIDMEQENNFSEMVTGIYPYYKRSTNDEQYASNPIIYGSIVNGPGTYTVPRIEAVDLTEHFPNNVPTAAQITAKAREWVAHEEIGVPEVSLTIQYATLGQDVRMYDAIRVIFKDLGVDTKAKVVKYRYNVLLDRCEEIEVGHAKSSALFDLMDANRLRKGLVPPERIQNESITNEKIAQGGVGKGKIAPQAVETKNIELGAIDHNLLSGSGGHGAPAVNGENVQDRSIESIMIAKEAVIAENIAGGAVDGAKLALLAVDTQHIANNAVKERTIENEAVKTAKIAQRAINEGRLADAAVAFAKLKSGTNEPATVINNLKSEVAYIGTLFTSNVWANSFHTTSLYATNFIYNNYTVYEAQVPGDASGVGYYVLATRRYVR